MNNTTVTKLKDTEIDDIKNLQSKFQETRLKFGDLQIYKLQLDSAVSEFIANEKKLKEEWEVLQKNEKELLAKILGTYGEGSISLSDGTFIPNTKKT